MKAVVLLMAVGVAAGFSFRDHQKLEERQGNQNSDCKNFMTDQQCSILKQYCSVPELAKECCETCNEQSGNKRTEKELISLLRRYLEEKETEK